MAAVLYIKPHDVRHRLADLDLTVEIVQDVGRAARIAKTGCSPNHPPTFRGTAAWANAIKHLRDVLIPLGWRRDDPANFSMTINDKRRIYIVVATGDNLAGIEGPGDPRTKTAKGVWAEEALNLNRQLDLFPEAIPEHIRMRPEAAGYVAWYLLIVVSAEQIRVELSRPLDMVGDKVAVWAERIILPTFDFGPGDVEADPTDFGPDFDPDVRRIG
jgi:hypothetical protein